jgi:hypothetical protein
MKLDSSDKFDIEFQQFEVCKYLFYKNEDKNKIKVNRSECAIRIYEDASEMHLNYTLKNFENSSCLFKLGRIKDIKIILLPLIRIALRGIFFTQQRKCNNLKNTFCEQSMDRLRHIRASKSTWC